jgi:hypothetical protein
MPLSIRNSETVALAKDVAARSGKTVTRAIHEALEKESARLQAAPVLRPETESYFREHHAQLRASSTNSRIVDKAFYDSLYDD